MRPSAIRVLLPIVAFFLLAVPAAYAQKVEPNRSCEQALNCDCANVEGGLLTRSWQRDCQACEKKLIDACKTRYPPLSIAVSAGGYCQTSCSVVGPHARPRPPDDTTRKLQRTGTAPGAATSTDDVSLLHCATDSRESTFDADGLSFFGCVNGDGQREGLFVAIDASGRLIEVVFVDGKEVSREAFPPS
jgi:hypothetical protein